MLFLWAYSVACGTIRFVSKRLFLPTFSGKTEKVGLRSNGCGLTASTAVRCPPKNSLHCFLQFIILNLFSRCGKILERKRGVCAHGSDTAAGLSGTRHGRCRCVCRHACGLFICRTHRKRTQCTIDSQPPARGWLFVRKCASAAADCARIRRCVCVQYGSNDLCR